MENVKCEMGNVKWEMGNFLPRIVLVWNLDSGFWILDSGLFD